MIAAVIPAAGKSSRMGRPKLSLPFRGSTVLEHVVRAFRTAGIEKIVVAVGPHVPELFPLVERSGAEVSALPHETPDMRATVEAALNWIESRWSPNDHDAWLLAPADHPCLESSVIERLIEERQHHPEATIVIPTHEGKRGHPALIAWSHVAGIHAFPRAKGLNEYFRGKQSETCEVVVSSRGILIDLDTPGDYEQAR